LSQLKKIERKINFFYLGERGVVEERDDAGIVRAGLEIRIFLIL
jgi:hypothetical protein